MKMRKFLAATTALTLLLGIAATPEVGSEIKLALTAHAESGEIPIDAAHFPDENFREYVKEFDIDGNNSFSVDEILKVKEIFCTSCDISSLNGIEYFTALEHLSCGYNELTSLDVSKNTAITHLFCENNNMTSLDVDGCTELIDLECFDNQLTELNVSMNTKLTELHCYRNKLSKIDVSKNAALANLWCFENQLTSLDVSKNTELKTLSCYRNQLTELNVSTNTKLENLYCYSNELKSLDISSCTSLTTLHCSSNNLTSLDVCKNTALIDLDCGENQISLLDVSGCAKLGSLSCASNKLIELDVSKNTELTVLRCEDNQIAKLNVSSCAKLKWFACYTNKLTELDISNNPNIVKAYTEGVDTGYLSDGVFGREFDENLIDGTYYYILWDKATKLITGIEPEEVEVGTADVTGLENISDVDITDMGITFEDESGKTYTAQVQSDGKIMLPSLPAGEYTVTASLENCPSRDYEVTVEAGKPVELDVELKLYGDLNGDGILTVFDVMPVNKCAQKTDTLDGYDFKVADVTNDNNINVFDCMKINAHIKKTALMW